MADRDVMRRAEEIAAGIAWQPLGPPTVPTVAELSAAFTRLAGAPVEVTNARLEGDVLRCSVRMPVYGAAVVLGEPCPCGASGQPAGACSLCDAYPWDPAPEVTP
jgi:hypothetical protein